MRSRLRIILAWVLAAGACGGCGGSITSEELRQRAADSRPSWQGYQEDIKTQVGARPVAEWEGQPVSVYREGDVLGATFRLRGPWRGRQVAIPILLQEPYGGIHQSTRAEYAEGTVTYLFEFTEPAPPAAFPWVELKFPNGERRIALSEHGGWSAPPEQPGSVQ